MGPDAPASHMVYLIEPQGDVCKLTIEHYDLAPGQEGFAEGWARLAASLKSYLETGTALKGGHVKETRAMTFPTELGVHTRNRAFRGRQTDEETSR
jgi:hypothetical protein